jgi:hypothetical protein
MVMSNAANLPCNPIDIPYDLSPGGYNVPFVPSQTHFVLLLQLLAYYRLHSRLYSE